MLFFGDGIDSDVERLPECDGGGQIEDEIGGIAGERFVRRERWIEIGRDGDRKKYIYFHTQRERENILSRGQTEEEKREEKEEEK